MSIVITVSRQLGSRGSYIAAATARELGLRYLDREVLHQAAEMVGFPDEKMMALLEEKEQERSFFERILEALATLPPVPMVPSATLREGYAYNDIITTLMATEGLSYEEALCEIREEQQRVMRAAGYADLIQQVILDCAQAGDAIIVGRGGQMILQNMPGVLHVQIIAPEKTRVRRLMRRMGIDEKEARRQVQQSDKNRTYYLRHFHDVDWRNPDHYDMVLNTNKLSVEMTTELICKAARQLAH
ncbi:MAG: cytidylate kinase-like family protein [Chloroflexota bacterium]|nr:cytidylate kinase-like family protein [Chloroflexota bacterium]